MRGWMFTALVAVPLALAAVPPAQAQQAGKQQVRIAKGSPLAKVFFSEPALVLDDDGTYAGAMQRVGKELSRDCGAVESYAWDFKGAPREQQQQRASTVFDGTMESFKRAGFTLAEKKVRAIPDPETMIYTADGKEKRLVLMWSPVQDATLLLICDAGKAPPPAPAAPAPKAPPKKQ
jgi:hypothetical protein